LGKQYFLLIPSDTARFKDRMYALSEYKLTFEASKLLVAGMQTFAIVIGLNPNRKSGDGEDETTRSKQVKQHIASGKTLIADLWK
jgi:hypothetical protein